MCFKQARQLQAMSHQETLRSCVQELVILKRIIHIFWVLLRTSYLIDLLSQEPQELGFAVLILKMRRLRFRQLEDPVGLSQLASL